MWPSLPYDLDSRAYWGAFLVKGLLQIRRVVDRCKCKAAPPISPGDCVHNTAKRVCCAAGATFVSIYSYYSPFAPSVCNGMIHERIMLLIWPRFISVSAHLHGCSTSDQNPAQALQLCAELEEIETELKLGSLAKLWRMAVTG